MVTGTLKLLQGKAAPRERRLDVAEILIGRDPACHVVIDDDSVSRKHARVIRDGDTFAVEDLGSKNGTYVNGHAVEGKRRLANGDRIEICSATLRFKSSRPPTFAAKRGSGTSVVSIDAVAGEDTVLRVNAAGKLRAILQITRSLGRTLDLRALLSNMLNGLLDIFPQADRGLVLLRDKNRLVPAAVKDRRGKQGHVQYSKTIAAKAVVERKAILSQDVIEDDEIPVTASITQLRIHSVMCVPLLSQDMTVLGVIQMDIQDTKKGFDTDDMEILTSVASQASVAIEQAQLHREMMKHARIQRELDFAREVQHSFLPKSMPELEGYRFWVYYEAAREVGGDFYDFLRLPNGKEAVLLGDVAGKGIPAALMMAKVSSLCKLALLSHPDDLGRAMSALNREVFDAGTERGFVTLVLSIIDPSTDELTIAVAGHMTPMIRRADATVDDSAGYEARGRPLGIERELCYETDCRKLEPGDLVVLFSDGISEAMDEADEPYTVERVGDQLRATGGKGPTETGQSLLHDVRRHVGQGAQRDDMSLVIFQRAPENDDS